MIAAFVGCFEATVGGGTGTPSATASPNDLFGVRRGGGTVTTGSYSTVGTQYLVAPITYSWTFVSGDATVLPNSPNSGSTKFSSYLEVNGVKTAVYKCVVTGAGPTVVDTNNVSINLNSLPNTGNELVIV